MSVSDAAVYADRLGIPDFDLFLSVVKGIEAHVLKRQHEDMKAKRRK